MKIISLDNLKYVLKYLKNDFTAAKAYADEFGNNIRSTYVRKGDKVATAALADRAITAGSVNWSDVRNKPDIENGFKDCISKKKVLQEDEYGNLPDGDLSTMLPGMNGRAAVIADAIQFHKKKEDGSSKKGTIEFDGQSFTSDIPFNVHVTGAVDSATWDSISGKPEKFPAEDHNHDELYIKKSDTNILTDMSNSLNVRKTLGTEEKPYNMQWQDFDKIGIYHIACSAEEIACHAGKEIATSHEIYAFNTSGHDGARSFSLIGTSPDLISVYIGRFDNGVWSGWKEIVEQGQSLQTQNVVVSQETIGDGVVVKKNGSKLASVALGDPSDKSWNIYNLEDKLYISANNESRTENYAIRIDNDSMHTTKKTVAESGMEVKQSLTIPTSDDGTGNIWIS